MKTNKYILILIGSVLGGLGGFLYWKYFGCADGSCPLKSNWLIMTVYGVLVGNLIFSFLPVKKKNIENNK